MSTKPAARPHPRRRRTALLAAPALAVLATAGTVAASAPAQASTASTIRPNDGYGYVSQGNLRTDPNQDSNNIEVTIYNQWIDIKCWVDGGFNGFGSDRWFKAQYYSNVGYISSGVVSSQPTVGHC